MDQMSRRTIDLPDDEWVLAWITWYGAHSGTYARLADVVERVLASATDQHAPLAIVHTRPKALASYAGKIQRKLRRYRETDVEGRLVHPITDLCGARVITHTLDHVKAMCRFIEEHFDIDQANSVDVGKRLRVNEFGYLSVHYVVRFIPDVFPTRAVPVRVPRTLCGLDVEIQVRTLLQHAWADISHDLSYKSTFTVPDNWQREFARLAAVLEDADEAFCRVGEGLAAYAANYGAYMSPEQMHTEIAKAHVVLQCDPGNVEVAHRIARLATCLGDWAHVIRILTPLVGLENPAILRDLGVAMCKRYKAGSRNFRRGQAHLRRAVELAPTDSDAIASLGGTWRGVDDAKALEYYRRALEVAPTDPYPLGNYLELEIARSRSLQVISPAMSSLRAAVLKCRQQADVQMNIPWAYYDMGKFNLLLQRPYEALGAYAKGVADSGHEGMTVSALVSLGHLGKAREAIEGLPWVRQFLEVAVAGRFGKRRPSARFRKLATPTSRTHKPIQGPVVMLVGECGRSVGRKMTSYRKVLTAAFGAFDGTIISGGTTTGVARLAGDVGRAAGKGLRVVGYVPAGATPDGDRRRYADMRRTRGKDFSPLESIQAWTDILAADIAASDVIVLGIGGGAISLAEYRMALALGAKVGLLRNSGGAAGEMLMDRDWCTSPLLFELPVDAMSIRAFVESRPKPLDDEIRTTIARAIHEAYRDNQSAAAVSENPSLAEWNDLNEDLKDSNRLQADHIEAKLALLGCTVARPGAPGRKVRRKFSRREVEFLAEMEHGRWVAERTLAGWVPGPEKNVARRVSPYLVAWSELPEDIREIDRRTVRQIPDFLAQAGLEIHETA